jgi:hypothetical protein
METLSFKVSEDEARSIRARAQQAKLTVSEYLRRRALNRSSKKSTNPLVRCPKTGAMIFAPLPGEPPLTTESVRGYLADFP